MWMLRYACLALLTGCFEMQPIDFGDFGFGDLGGFGLSVARGTTGENGNLAFGYLEGCPGARSSGAQFVAPCELSIGAILTSSTTRIHLHALGENLPALTVASSSPAVFDVGPIDHAPGSDDASVQITAHAAGQAKLVVSSTGAIYDQVNLDVADPVSLAFTDAAPVLLAGAEESIPVIAMGASGTQLFGRGAIQLDANGLARAATYDPSADGQFYGTDHFVLSGALVGTTTITASLGALAATSLVTIADQSEVAQIVVTPAASDLPDHEIIEVFEAVTATGSEVRGAHCTPSVTAAFPVSIAPMPEGLVPAPILPGDDVMFAAASGGPVTLSCAFDGVVGSVDLTF